jgi:hypothetical protein
MLGLAVGDAVGTTLEFRPSGSFAKIDDMVGGSLFHLAAGEWADAPAEGAVSATTTRQSGFERQEPRPSHSCQAIGRKTGSTARDYIQLYEGDAKLVTASLEYIQKTASQMLNPIDVGPVSALRF